MSAEARSGRGDHLADAIIGVPPEQSDWFSLSTINSPMRRIGVKSTDFTGPRRESKGGLGGRVLNGAPS